MKIRTLGMITLVGALLGGCSAVRVSDPASGLNYYDGAFEYATLDGKIDTHVVGSPFANSGPGFAQTVTANMKGATRGRDVAFVPSPRNTTKHNFHVVVVFNGKNPLVVSEVCENADEVTSVPAQRTTVMLAVFCHDNHPLSYASGLVEGLESPDDSRFQQLIKQVALAMIPGFDYHRASGFTPF